MTNRHTDRMGHGHLRLVFSDRVVSYRLDANATLADVAETLCNPGQRHSGESVAIEVTMGDSPALLRPSDFLPRHFRFEDDPAAEMDCSPSTHLTACPDDIRGR
jgi:hypothetical protein